MSQFSRAADVEGRTLGRAGATTGWSLQHLRARWQRQQRHQGQRRHLERDGAALYDIQAEMSLAEGVTGTTWVGLYLTLHGAYVTCCYHCGKACQFPATEGYTCTGRTESQHRTPWRGSGAAPQAISATTWLAALAKAGGEMTPLAANIRRGSHGKTRGTSTDGRRGRWRTGNIGRRRQPILNTGRDGRRGESELSGRRCRKGRKALFWQAGKPSQGGGKLCERLTRSLLDVEATRKQRQSGMASWRAGRAAGSRRARRASSA